MFDDLQYCSRDTWASKRKVVRQERVIIVALICLTLYNNLYNTIPRKQGQRRLNSLSKTWAFPYITLTHTSFRFIFHPLGPWRANRWISCRNMCQSPPKGQHVSWYAILKKRYVGEQTKSSTARRGHK